ncbi:MAG TPA: UDP-glucose 4-epimerase GalE [Hyphomonadaceae bacterium]|nr:UDP-glucose 4-epimerase GalE [Hyphomonadaceae bacterium]
MGNRSILVTGGAGYIGSHVALALLDAGYDVTIVDNLSTGSAAAAPADADFIEGDVSDDALMARLMAGGGVDAVMHFAASAVAPASVRDPFSYYSNNTGHTIALGTQAARAGVPVFVFSSTAAVYRSSGMTPVDEDAPTAPQSPYGWSKLMSEQILRDMAAAAGFRLGILRYFNVAGADPLGRAGQRSPNATHLIKVACEHALGRREAITVYGTDFDTPDGTGVRDYIHVTDLADAHVAALTHLFEGGDGFVLNCGYGRGSSVLDVAHAIERVSGRPVNLRYAARRAGDPAVVLANADRLRRLLNWTPHFDDLDRIVRTALDWERHIGQLQLHHANDMN